MIYKHCIKKNKKNKALSVNCLRQVSQLSPESGSLCLPPPSLRLPF